MHRILKYRFLGLLAVALLMLPGIGVAGAQGQGTKLVLEQFYLHGGELDQVTKLLGDDEPTFSQDEPTGEDSSAQVVASYFTVVDQESSLRAYWVGPFEGEVDGELELTFSYTAPLSDQLTFRAWDVDPDSANTRLGEARNVTVPSTTTSTDPEDHTVTIQVKGTVAGTLLIEALTFQPHTNAVFYYGSKDDPSGFVLPTIVPCEIGAADPDCT